MPPPPSRPPRPPIPMARSRSPLLAPGSGGNSSVPPAPDLGFSGVVSIESPAPPVSNGRFWMAGLEPTASPNAPATPCALDVGADCVTPPFSLVPESKFVTRLSSSESLPSLVPLSITGWLPVEGGIAAWLPLLATPGDGRR